ncbi:MAG: DUF5818 domain-containing protein [Myxococcota bacterium]
MKLEGHVKRVHLAGGVWQLVTADGKKFQLEGGGDELRVDGQAVVVEGDIAKGRMSIGMSAPTLVVARWSPAPSAG